MYALLLCTLVLSVQADYKWPDDHSGPRTADLESASERAAKFIACDVCKEVVYSLFPEGLLQDPLWSEHWDGEVVNIMTSGQLVESLGDHPDHCSMNNLAKMFKNRKLSISTDNTDGTAKLVKVKNVPRYETKITKDNATEYHWRSFAVKDSCKQVFRGEDFEKMADRVKAAYEEEVDGLRKKKIKEWHDPAALLRNAAGSGCYRTKACLEGEELRGRGKAAKKKQGKEDL